MIGLTYARPGRSAIATLLCIAIGITLASAVQSSGAEGPYIPPFQPPLIIKDIYPPTTNISLSGTEGENGWWTSGVTVTLKATDLGVGVDTTMHSIFREGQTMAMALEYKGPFLVKYEGINRVSYYSTDKSGNTETSKAATIKIDNVPPEGSMVIKGSPQYTTNASVTLTLEASDASSGIAKMRFKNEGRSWGSWETYATTKSWSLAPGDSIRKVYTQFKDRAGLTSPEYNDSIILDTSPPSISMTTENGTKIKSSEFELNWTATDSGSGIDHYEVSVDGGSWTSTGTKSSLTVSDLEVGEHTFEIKAVDKTGKSEIYALTISVSKGFLGKFGLLLIILIIAVVAAVLIIWWLRRRPKKPPTPEKMKIQAEPKEIIADGKSTSTITIQLLDKGGKPAGALNDTDVKLSVTSGRLTNQVVKFAKGADTGNTVLVSSTKFGTVNLSAEANGLESASMALNFKEKPRFCMGCGSRMSVKDTRCEKCGASPSHFGGPETKTCHCGTVLPFTANFCSECGAKQGPSGEPSAEEPPAEGPPSGEQPEGE